MSSGKSNRKPTDIKFAPYLESSTDGKLTRFFHNHSDILVPFTTHFRDAYMPYCEAPVILGFFISAGSMIYLYREFRYANKESR